MEGKNKKMDCKYYNREYFIEGYLLNTLTEAERDKFAEHLFGCEACQKELQFREALKETIVQEARDRQAAVRVAAPARWKFAGYAAAAMAAILVLSFFAYNIFQKPSHRTPVLAKNFEPSPDLEPLVGQIWRSGNTGIDSVLSPFNYANYTGDVTFRWRGDTVTLEISVFNNRDSLVIAPIRVHGKQYILKDAGTRLRPGRYYWKLDIPASRKPPYTGCFFINKPDSL